MTMRTTTRRLLIGATLALAAPVCAQVERGEQQQEPAAKQTRETDGAAVAYRRVVAHMREQFGERCERLPETDHEAELGATQAAATSDEWRRAVTVAAPVFAQWRLAVAEPRCVFRATSSELLSTEFMDGFLALHRCRQLVVVRGMQAIADRDTEAAVATVEGLLAHAAHLRQEPSMVAWSVAASSEKQVVALHEAVAHTLGHAAGERTRTTIRRHVEASRGLAAAGAAARIETFRLFDGTVTHMQRGGGAKAKILRELLSEVRHHFTRLVDPPLAALERATAEWTPELRDELNKRSKELIARKDERLQVLEALRRDGNSLPDGNEPAPDLALLLATLLAPDLESLAADQHAALERLRTASR